MKDGPRDTRYEKIANLPGFRFLVESARHRLGKDITLFGEGERGDDSVGLVAKAVSTIMDLYQLGNEEEIFVWNTLLSGIDRALGTEAVPRVTFLVPDIPRGVAHDLAVEVTEKLWPKSRDARWLEVTQNGEPSDVRHIGLEPPEMTEFHERKGARAKVVKGPGVIALFIRNGPRIYMDVTNATQDDIRKAVTLVPKLRKELRESNPTLRRGARVTRDDAKAVKAALLHRDGQSYVEIGRRFRWQVYTEDVVTGTCPTAVDYVRLGNEILDKVRVLEEALGPEVKP